MPEQGGVAGQGQLEALALMVLQLQLAVLALARRPAVHLAVEHLDLERLEFHIGSIDVDQLNGELNIGLTAMFKAGAQPGAQGGGQGEGPGQTPGDSRQMHQIWPPIKGGGKTDEPSPADGASGSEGGARRASG